MSQETPEIHNDPSVDRYKSIHTDLETENENNDRPDYNSLIIDSFEDLDIKDNLQIT